MNDHLGYLLFIPFIILGILFIIGGIKGIIKKKSLMTTRGGRPAKMLYIKNISKFHRRMKVNGGDFILRWYSGGIFF
jgi:hypothetical protein